MSRGRLQSSTSIFTPQRSQHPNRLGRGPAANSRGRSVWPGPPLLVRLPRWCTRRARAPRPRRCSAATTSRAPPSFAGWSRRTWRGRARRARPQMHARGRRARYRLLRRLAPSASPPVHLCHPRSPRARPRSLPRRSPIPRRGRGPWKEADVRALRGGSWTILAWTRLMRERWATRPAMRSWQLPGRDACVHACLAATPCTRCC
jgi:hypothetical protein